jgi:hypothetical protein
MPDLSERDGKLSCPSAKCGAKVNLLSHTRCNIGLWGDCYLNADWQLELGGVAVQLRAVGRARHAVSNEQGNCANAMPLADPSFQLSRARNDVSGFMMPAPRLM